MKPLHALSLRRKRLEDWVTGPSMQLCAAQVLLKESKLARTKTLTPEENEEHPQRVPFRSGGQKDKSCPV